MRSWSTLWAVVCMLGAGGVMPAAAATDQNSDWPCAQRLVPEIAPATIWAGPPLDSVDGQAGPVVDELAGELAARRVPLDDAEARVDDFARTLADPEKDAQLTRLFARTLAIINGDRTSIIKGINKYARGQRALAKTITETNERLSGLPQDQVQERDALIAQRDWDVRIYDDRRSSLTYLCEQPVLLEQRAFALARAIAGHLD